MIYRTNKWTIRAVQPQMPALGTPGFATSLRGAPLDEVSLLVNHNAATIANVGYTEIPLAGSGDIVRLIIQNNLQAVVATAEFGSKLPLYLMDRDRALAIFPPHTIVIELADGQVQIFAAKHEDQTNAAPAAEGKAS